MATTESATQPEVLTRPRGFLLKSRIDGAHPKLKDYYLLPEDLLVKEADGTFSKVGPGMAVGGFELTAEQEAELVEVEYAFYGLDFEVFELTD